MFHCLVIKVVCCFSTDSFDILSYLSVVVKNFFNLFFSSSFLLSLSATLISYHVSLSLSTLFLFYFLNFSVVLKIKSASLGSGIKYTIIYLYGQPFFYIFLHFFLNQPSIS